MLELKLPQSLKFENCWKLIFLNVQMKKFVQILKMFKVENDKI
jgi:hypothetical protein